MKDILLVEWNDATANQLWHEAKKENLHCQTIGFVVYEDDDQIELAGTIADDEMCNNSMSIPKKMILKKQIICYAK